MSWGRLGVQFNATLDADVLDEIRREATRQRRSICSLMREAWRLSRARIRTVPTRAEQARIVMQSQAHVANDEQALPEPWTDPGKRWAEALRYQGRGDRAPVPMAKRQKARTLKR